MFDKIRSTNAKEKIDQKKG